MLAYAAGMCGPPIFRLISYLFWEVVWRVSMSRVCDRYLFVQLSSLGLIATFYRGVCCHPGFFSGEVGKGYTLQQASPRTSRGTDRTPWTR